MSAVGEALWKRADAPTVRSLRTAPTPIGHFWQAAILGALTAEETQEWHTGTAQAVAEGTYFIAQAHHGAIGIKPETVG